MSLPRTLGQRRFDTDGAVPGESMIHHLESTGEQDPVATTVDHLQAADEPLPSAVGVGR
jgi:hypothetical protein